jgi:hypothetical protein
MTIGSIILIIVMVLFVLCAIKMSNDTGKLYAGLDEIWDRAKRATTREELKAIYDELRDYSKKHCWHRYHGDYARKIQAYIEGRLAGVK